MAKNPAADSIMGGDKLKPLLALSKKEPLQAAIGLTSDGEGVILLDKKAKPRAIMALLKSRAAKLQIKLNPSSIRFGRAEVDVEYDPAMVRFFVNKETPGVMRVKLIEVVKPIAYQKVEINVDPSLELNDEDTEADGSVDAAATQHAERAVPDAHGLAAELATLARRIPDLAGNDAARRARLLKLATDTNADIKAGNFDDATHLLAETTGAETPAVAAQPTPLSAELADLIRRIPEAAGAALQAKAELMRLAAAANARLKSADAAQAGQQIADLRAALDRALGAVPAGAGQDGQQSGDELLAAFRDAKDEVDDGLNKLRQALLDTNDIDLARIAEYGLYGISNGGGVGLMKALLDLRAQTPATKDALVKAAQDAAAAYKAAILSEPVIDLIDNNPFGVEIGIQTKLVAALEHIAQAA